MSNVRKVCLTIGLAVLAGVGLFTINVIFTAHDFLCQNFERPSEKRLLSISRALTSDQQHQRFSRSRASPSQWGL